MKNNAILLEQWLAKTLVDNLDLLASKNPAEIYAELQKIWFLEIQEAFKNIVKKYNEVN